MVKAVVFDLWNTLAYNEYGGLKVRPLSGIMHFIGDKIGLKDGRWEIHHEMEKSFMLKEYSSAEEGMRDFCRYFGKNETHADELAKIWDKITIKLFDDVVPVLNDLGKDYKLGLLTNTHSFAMDFFARKKFFDMFDVVCLSFKVGLIKPDPEFFRLALKKLNVKPSEATMVGDNLHSDVLGAQAVGMNGILIRRRQKFLGWKETEDWNPTITSLHDLRKFL